MVEEGELDERDFLIIALLSGVFGASIVFANIAAGIKLINIFGLVVPAGTIAYCVTFPITDIVDEVYGKRRALYVVWAGLTAEIVMLALIGVDYILPPLQQEHQELYGQVFSPQLRIVLGSLVAYLLSQHHDVWAFWKLREITGGKWLWLRNNASTTASQLMDSIAFATIAFYGVVPTGTLFNMIVSMWAFKALIALLDTPAVYLGVLVARKQVKGEIAEPRVKLVERKKTGYHESNPLRV